MKHQFFNKKERLPALLSAVAVVASLGMMWFSEKRFSPVDDELANVPSALNFVKTGRYTDPTHPILLRHLIDAPLWATGVDALPQDSAGVMRWEQYGRDFLFKNNRPWRETLTATRCVTMTLTIAMLALGWHWARRLWGAWGGAATAVFLAFEPNILAHGQLATLDGGFAAAYFAAAFFLWKYIERPSWANFWWLNLALGAALLSKSTGAVMFPAAAICLCLFRKKVDLRLKRFWLTPPTVFLMAWASFLFQMKPAADDPAIVAGKANPLVAAQFEAAANRLGTTAERLMAVPIPAYDFWKSFAMQSFHAMFQDKWRRKEKLQYLDGELSRRGWREYFLKTFLYKSSLATIGLLGLAGFFFLKNRHFGPAAACLVVPPVMLFAFVSMGTINIGHRYMLPVYPSVAMAVGWLVFQKETWLKWGVAALLAAHVGSSLAAWPHHLAYFNELSRSGRHLADSNVDWGQDLLFLQNDLDEHQGDGRSVCGDPYGFVRPSDLGINLPPIPEEGLAALPPGPKRVYLSHNYFLNCSTPHPKTAYEELRRMRPARRAGSSILVFELER